MTLKYPGQRRMLPAIRPSSSGTCIFGAEDPASKGEIRIHKAVFIVEKTLQRIRLSPSWKLAGGLLRHRGWSLCGFRINSNTLVTFSYTIWFPRRYMKSIGSKHPIRCLITLCRGSPSRKQDREKRNSTNLFLRGIRFL